MTTQVLLYDVFFEKGSHLNATEYEHFSVALTGVRRKIIFFDDEFD